MGGEEGGVVSKASLPRASARAEASDLTLGVVGLGVDDSEICTGAGVDVSGCEEAGCGAPVTGGGVEDPGGHFLPLGGVLFDYCVNWTMSRSRWEAGKSWGRERRDLS